MAHNISKTNGKDAMFYVGERPWHGLGTELEAPASAAEAIAAAGLDWEIEERAIYWKVMDDKQEAVGKYLRMITGHHANVRQDTGAVLGVVGERYQVIQNRDAFTFFDHVVGQGQAVYHTAGALGVGERVWILAKLPGDIVIKKHGTEDRTEKFLLLSNSHNGWSTLRMFFTPIRVVCQNTLNAALGKTGSGIAIRHTGEIKGKVAEAQRALGLAVRFYDDMTQLAQTLAGKAMKPQQIEAYVGRVFPSRKDEPSSRIQNVRRDVLELIEHGKGNDAAGIRGTAWAALNGVVEYVDHGRAGRGKTAQEQTSSRLESAWFGYGATIKARAWDAAVALVK